ncbi:fumarate hydratase [bacterium]|nr:fumarate hydratase [bacterium]
MKISSNTICKAIYNLIEQANIMLPQNIYNKIKSSKIDENKKNLILENAKIAFDNKRPLCQDTGQVTIFFEIGQNVTIEGEFIEDVINKAVEDCYREKFYRKSTCKDALYDRNNNGKNTPAIIHFDFIKEDKINILVALKGGGAENMSGLKMFSPTSTKEEIFEYIKSVAHHAVKNSCPPLSVGVGVGGTIEKCTYLAKRALYFGEEIDLEIDNVFEVKMLTSETHIASLPVCVNINCHSARYASATIADNKIKYGAKPYEFKETKTETSGKKINTDEIETIKNLKKGDEILLSGTIYTARDMAHKKLIETMEIGEKLPFEINNSIIFYAGPCPKNENEIIGPIGPTTSSRMDKYAPILFEKGVLASIGKGERNIQDGIYFEAIGGIASYMQRCVTSCDIVAYEEFGPEAIYKLEVKDLPLTVK